MYFKASFSLRFKVLESQSCGIRKNIKQKLTQTLDKYERETK